jgi:hypothetical protein
MALFQIGAVVATPAALEFCQSINIAPITLLRRHMAGDWGDLTQEDVKANKQGIQHDLCIFSSYKFPQGKVWVIAESDRSSTCVLRPDDY